MSKQTDTSLFIISSVPTLYQALLSGIESYKDLGIRTIGEIKTAHAFRQVEQVAELSQILINNPIKEYQLIGQYYLAWSKYRGNANQTKMIERVIEQSKTYKAKALTFRGALSFYQASFDEATFFYTESLKTVSSISEYIEASRCVATTKAAEGFHNSALKDLESLSPLLRYAEPKLYYDFLNSYAVELGEAGRKYEARNIIRHVIASPFIIAYPEWQETAEELREPNRSFVFVDPLPARMGKLLSMPVVEPAGPVKQGRPALVVNLETWKAKMGKKKNGEKNLDALDSRQLLLRLMELGTAPRMTDDKLYKVLEMMEKLLAEPDNPNTPEKLDDEDSGA